MTFDSSRGDVCHFRQGQRELAGFECTDSVAGGCILFDGDLAPGYHRLGIPYNGWIVVRLQSEAGEVWTKRIWIHS